MHYNLIVNIVPKIVAEPLNDGIVAENEVEPERPEQFENSAPECKI